jgi:hypothetical protein
LFISTKEGEGDSALLLLWDVATGFQDFKISRFCSSQQKRGRVNRRSVSI